MNDTVKIRSFRSGLTLARCEPLRRRCLDSPLAPNGEPKLLLPVVVLPEPLLGEDVMDKLINELLLLTCMGTFVASATYAVTLLH